MKLAATVKGYVKRRNGDLRSQISDLRVLILDPYGIVDLSIHSVYNKRVCDRMREQIY
jgi:hypothetical protein